MLITGSILILFIYLKVDQISWLVCDEYHIMADNAEYPGGLTMRKLFPSRGFKCRPDQPTTCFPGTYNNPPEKQYGQGNNNEFQGNR